MSPLSTVACQIATERTRNVPALLCLFAFHSGTSCRVPTAWAATCTKTMQGSWAESRNKKNWHTLTTVIVSERRPAEKRRKWSEEQEMMPSPMFWNTGRGTLIYHHPMLCGESDRGGRPAKRLRRHSFVHVRFSLACTFSCVAVPEGRDSTSSTCSIPGRPVGR